MEMLDGNSMSFINLTTSSETIEEVCQQFSGIFFFFYKEKSGNSLFSLSQEIRVGSFDVHQRSIARLTQFLLNQTFEA